MMGVLDNFGMGALGFVPFVLIISILIFVHELGHFLVGRWCGVKVVTFSIGLRTEIVRLRRQARYAFWRIAAIPLGGYVRFFPGRCQRGLDARRRAQSLDDPR